MHYVKTLEEEIAYYNSLPCKFEGFVDAPDLSDGVVRLINQGNKPGDPEKKLVPQYNFAICLMNGEKIGDISFRAGYSENLYYGGQIGFNVDEGHRGNGYAGRACRLVARMAAMHGMTTLLITNDHKNEASKRVCEKLGARLVRVARLPEWNDLYKQGGRFENIFEWNLR